MTSTTTRKTMTLTNTILPKKNHLTLHLVFLLGLASGIVGSGCGPTFDPASLIKTTRVLGAQVEIEGAPGRANPKPGETVKLTWILTSPDTDPPLGWAFAVCTPSRVGSEESLQCLSTPFAMFEGTESTPQLSIPIPSVDALNGANSVMVFGEICSGPNSLPTFDSQNGIPGCTGGGGTTVSIRIPLQLSNDLNHNPSAPETFTFNGEPWPKLASSDDPCIWGPWATPEREDHRIGILTLGSLREAYTVMRGDPPVATSVRERLQISNFTTAGKLKSQFAFVEATDQAPQTTVHIQWEAPKTELVPTAGLPVEFSFVVRDDRGGTNWTTRTLCVRQ